MTTIQDIAKRTTALFELLAALNKAADDAGLPESVCFTGYMFNARIAAIRVTSDSEVGTFFVKPEDALSQVRGASLVTFEDFLAALTGA